MTLPRFAIAIALALVLPAAVLNASQTASCNFTTFSAPADYTLNQVSGIADDGTVVGQLIDNDTGETQAFARSSNGAFTRFQAPNSLNTWFYGGNSSVNAGTFQIIAYPQGVHGFFLQAGKFTEVNYPGATNTWLYDINQTGTAVGSYSVSPSVTKGFVLAGGKYTSIAYPKSAATYAQAISDSGVVAGSYADGWVTHGFLWQNGTFTPVNHPNARWGSALLGVNNSGTAVGNYFAGDFAYGFVYKNGTFENIVYSGAQFTNAGGINNNGVISGQILDADGNTLGFTATCK
ncbi:MAG: hypothetical protein WAK29_04255 [Terriglobales bacterium]